MHGLDAAAEQEMEARATALQSAQAEFDAAVAAAKAAGETPAASTPDLRERVLDAAVEVKQRAAGGTFSGFAGRMFDFGTTTDHQADIAKHTEDTAKHVGQIARHGVKARLTYAA
jgi:hypothetical protein